MGSAPQDTLQAPQLLHWLIVQSSAAYRWLTRLLESRRSEDKAATVRPKPHESAENAGILCKHLEHEAWPYFYKQLARAEESPAEE